MEQEKLYVIEERWCQGNTAQFPQEMEETTEKQGNTKIFSRKWDKVE